MTLAAPTPTGPRYRVEEGDTLFGLSRRFGVPPPELAQINGLTVDSGLRTGQQLSLPPGTWSDGLAIRVTRPSVGATVDSPIVVEGTAATFESIVTVEALGPDGVSLARIQVSASNPDVGQHGPFRASLEIPSVRGGGQVTVRVYWTSPRDGSVRDEVRLPVVVQ